MAITRTSRISSVKMPDNTVHNIVPTSLGDSSTEYVATLKSLTNDAQILTSLDLNDLFGINGTLTLTDDDWEGDTATKVVSALGTNDLIDLYPATLADKEAASDADLFVSSNGNTLTFVATYPPQTAITFKYFITRGGTQ